MLTRLKKLNLLAGLCFAALLLLFVLPVFSPGAASSILESRVSRLEADNAQLRSQLSRLESQVSRLSGLESSNVRANQPRLSTPAPVPPSPRQLPSNDPMFDRLATLVIELKERVVRLEKRLDELF